MKIMNNKKTYTDMIKFTTFIDRFNYLKLDGNVGVETFGFKRYLNQVFYRSNEWKRIRNQIIARDDGCDLGIPGRYINGKVLIHHINPITYDDLLNRSPKLFDLDNLISVSEQTHNAIHYGDEKVLALDPIKRTKNDMCPWIH